MDRPRLIEQPLMRRLVAPIALAAGVIIMSACGAPTEAETSTPVTHGTLPHVEGDLPGTLGTEVPTSKWTPSTTTTTRKTYTTRTSPDATPMPPPTLNPETCEMSDTYFTVDQQCMTNKILGLLDPQKNPVDFLNTKEEDVRDQATYTKVRELDDDITDPALQAKIEEGKANRAIYFFGPDDFVMGTTWKREVKNPDLLYKIETTEVGTATTIGQKSNVMSRDDPNKVNSGRDRCLRLYTNDVKNADLRAKINCYPLDPIPL